MVSSSAIIVAISMLWLIFLSTNVSRLRMKEQISMGDGGNKTVRNAVRAHGNAVEAMVPYMVLVVVWELQGAGSGAVLGLSGAFLFGRLLHGWGLLGRQHRSRQLGATVSLVTSLILAVAVLWRGLA